MSVGWLVPGVPKSLLATVVVLLAVKAYEFAVLNRLAGLAVRLTPSDAGVTLPLFVSK